MSIDFYLIKSLNFLESHSFACRLAEKAYQQDHQITIWLDSAAAAQEMDNLLWSLSPTSFIPHERSVEDATIIKVGRENTSNSDIILNLTLNKIPAEIKWKRLLQIVPAAATLKEQARQLYRDYQKNNYEIKTHQMAK